MTGVAVPCELSPNYRCTPIALGPSKITTSKCVDGYRVTMKPARLGWQSALQNLLVVNDPGKLVTVKNNFFQKLFTTLNQSSSIR